MDSSEAKKLKQLEDENRKLKHVVAELTLDNRALKGTCQESCV
jgi:putative transposase